MIRPNRIEWAIIIYLFILLISGTFMQGYCMGQRYAEKQIYISSEAGMDLSQDPNTNPLYRTIQDLGYVWKEEQGWIK